MPYPTIFHLISDVFNKTAVRGVLIGGFAVNYYRVSRQTADVDFLIAQEDFKKISALLEKAGYKQDSVQETFVKLTTDKPYLMDIDFMFVDKETIEKIIKDAKEISIARQKFVIPCLNHLIALKLHSIKYNPKIRENKDMPDIIDLIRINRVVFKSKEFRQLCLKYGTEEIYNKILDRI